jgi:UDP-N-acetylmuramate--alanine ligase
LNEPFFDLSFPRRVHVVGIGGPGMNAIATCLVQMGHDVTGSDIRESDVIDRMRDLGVRVNIGHDAAVVEGRDVVVSSTAIPANNVERSRAREVGIPDLARAEMLAALCDRRRSIAVAGTHGKTTTTSLLVRTMERAGRRPSFVVGADLLGEGTGARWDDGEFLIVEADESDGTHLRLPLVGTILTNIDRDHLDHYGGFAGLVDGFEKYLGGVVGPRVVCIDDSVIAAIVDRRRDLDWITYGASTRADFHFSHVEAADGVTRFRVTTTGGQTIAVTSPLRGVHNVANATAVIAMASSLGVEPERAVEAIGGFAGVERRFSIIGSIDDITFVDDYAHLPREIDAVLRAARTSGDGWKRIVAVFQPNRFNRMAVMSPEYFDAFDAADLVVIADIYPSGTKPIAGVTGRLVVDAVRVHRPDLEVVYESDRDNLALTVSRLLRSGDVCISMGCGDVETLPREILELRSGAA